MKRRNAPPSTPRRAAATLVRLAAEETRGRPRVQGHVYFVSSKNKFGIQTLGEWRKPAHTKLRGKSNPKRRQSTTVAHDEGVRVEVIG